MLVRFLPCKSGSENKWMICQLFFLINASFSKMGSLWICKWFLLFMFNSGNFSQFLFYTFFNFTVHAVIFRLNAMSLRRLWKFGPIAESVTPLVNWCDIVQSIFRTVRSMDNTQNAQQQLLQRQAMNRSSFYMLLFLLSLLFLNFSDDETTRGGRPSIEDVLKSLQLEKEVLHNVTFGVNVTHVSHLFKLSDHWYRSIQPFPSPVASQIQEITAIGQRNVPSHFYRNITGVFRGRDCHPIL